MFLIFHIKLLQSSGVTLISVLNEIELLHHSNRIVMFESKMLFAVLFNIRGVFFHKSEVQD
jgi:hypothetical protein